MVEGTITVSENEKLKELSQNRLKSGFVTYKFIKLGEIEFERKVIDISNINSIQELIDKLDLNEKNIYKVELRGTRNIDVSEFEEQIKVVNKNVYEVIDETHVEYNLDELSKEETLKGIFAKKILNAIEEDKENENKYYKALEFVYKVMKG